MKPKRISICLLTGMLLGASTWVAAQVRPDGGGTQLDARADSTLTSDHVGVVSRRQTDKSTESHDVLVHPCGTTNATSTFDASRPPALTAMHERRSRDTEDDR